MLEIKFVRQNLTEVENALAARGEKADLEAFRDADQKRRDYLQQAETLRHQRNVASEQVAKMKKAGENADDIVAEMRTVSCKPRPSSSSKVQPPLKATTISSVS